jgi:hypothetical protein
MGLTYSREKELIIVNDEGSFDVGQILSTFSKIRSECDASSRIRILIVDSGSEFEPSQKEILEFVDAWSALFRGLSVRIGLLVNKDLHYGLGRVAEVYAENRNLPFRVFRNRSDAVRWVSEQ